MDPVVLIFLVAVFIWIVKSALSARQRRNRSALQAIEKKRKERELELLKSRDPPPAVNYSEDTRLAEYEREAVSETVPAWENFTVSETDALESEASKLFESHSHARFKIRPDYVNEYELITRGWEQSLIARLLGASELDMSPEAAIKHPELSVAHYKKERVEHFEEEGALRLSERWRTELRQSYRRSCYENEVEFAKSKALERYQNELADEEGREQARRKIEEVERDLKR